MNGCLIDDNHYTPDLLTRIKFPSQTVLVMDFYGNPIAGTYRHYTLKLGSIRHFGGTNCLFCDGHVERRRPKGVIDSYDEIPAGDTTVFWRGY